MAGTLLQDVKYALRVLARSPGFAAVAVMTLALGIGANTAIFSVVYGVLLHPLGFPHSDRLVTPVWNFGGAGGLESNVDITTFRFWRDRSSVFQTVAAYTNGGFNLTGGGQPERVVATYISADYFRTLGVEPALGRDFLPAEDSGSGVPVAILSYALWARHFAGDPHALGSSIALDGVPYTVIGVMPAGYRAIERGDLYIPLARAPGPQLGGLNLQVVGRLKGGLLLRQADAGMTLVAEEFKSSHPGRYPPRFAIELIPLQTYLGMGARSYLLLLFGAVSFVLLIACANVAGLLIARSAGRTGEIAVRLSLGASTGRLIRQLLTESAMLGVAGAVASLPVAYGGLALLLRVIPEAEGRNPLFAQFTGDILTRSSAIAINRWSLAFALGAGIVTAILFGLLPAWRAASPDVGGTLKEGAMRAAAARRGGRLRNALVAGEIAVTMVLLAGALLLGRTLLNLLRAGPGFDTAHLLAVQLWMGGTRYPTSAALADFYRSLEAQVERMPGAQSAAVVSCGMPLEVGGNFTAAIETVRGVQSVDLRAVSGSYFQTLGVPALAGREFNVADTGSSAPVAVINKEFAREYFGNRNPLGLHVTLGATMKNTPYLEAPREIVGVVGDVKSRLNFPPEPTVFVSNEQADRATVELFNGFYPVDLLVRSAGDPLLLGEPVRKAVASLDPSVPVGKIETMEQLRADSVGVERFLLAMMGIFAALALVLSAVGVYGVLAYTVAQRRPEIGLRMAVGATPADVLRMMLGQTARLAAAGIALGACAALALTRLLGSVLYGVGTADPASFAAAAALLAAAALAACVIPLWRAMCVDPAAALRHG